LNRENAKMTTLTISDQDTQAYSGLERFNKKYGKIAWSMWQHCYAALHNKGTTIHKYEMKALDMEIREEMLLGLDGLDRKYSHLFEGSVQSKLEDKMMKKRMLIMNVWAA
jgi:hypothetical protein